MSSQTFKAFWKDVAVKTLVTLFAGGIGLFLKFCWDWYNHDAVLATFKDWKSLFIGSVLSIVNFEIKLWWLIIIMLIYFGIRSLRLLNQIDNGQNNLKKQRRLVETRMPYAKPLRPKVVSVDQNEFLNYKADKFTGHTFTWEWVFNRLINEYEVKNITLICPTVKCDLMAMDQIGGVTFKCYNCGTVTHLPMSIKSIENAIEQKANEM